MPHPLRLQDRFGYDDSLDVVGVHMVGAIIGVLLTGAFAVAYSFAATLALLKLTDITVGLRPSDKHEEDIGFDISQHGEVAYRIGEG